MTRRYQAADLFAELDLIAESNPERAAERLGTTCAAIARAYQRAGRPEDARPYSAAADRQKYAARRGAAA